eukprot:386723-Pelagomonas_calceolata.AAC.4
MYLHGCCDGGHSDQDDTHAILLFSMPSYFPSSYPTFQSALPTLVQGAVLVDADSAYNSGALTTDRNSSAVSGHDKCSTGRRVDLTFRLALCA